MSAFDGGRDHDEERPPLNREWLARMAEVDGSFWLAPEPRLWLRDTVTLGLAVFNAVAWPVLLWLVIAL